jgi:hypothetical protein
MMVLFLGMAAFVLDIGHAFFSYRQLQEAVDAAALAGAQNLSAASPSGVVAQYDAESGGYNTNSNLNLNGVNSVSMVPGYPKYTCLQTSLYQAACVGPEDANAIQVKEQAIVPTFFARIFGIGQMTISATATSAILGVKNQPANIAIILDTTASMQTVDSNCTSSGGSASRIVCAEQGVTTLLQSLSPCNTALGCGNVTDGIALHSLDSVAIFTFPNVTNGSADNDYNCSGKNPSIPVYSLPAIGASTYAPSGSSTATYQITPFMSDYKSQDSGSTLDSASDLTMAVGAGKSTSGSSCPGMQAPGGDGTYYAGVIYAAQAALTAQAATETAADSTVVPVNIMIILTDGEANSSMIASTAANGAKTATKSSWPVGGGATSTITNYPSEFDQCQQAVAAANYAKSQGTQVYSIAYGSESSGCTTDSTGPQAKITPCQVMSEMASPNVYDSSGKLTKSYFYSDYQQSGTNSTCVSTGSGVSSMNGIFKVIGNQFLNVRLIPDNVWPTS